MDVAFCCHAPLVKDEQDVFLVLRRYFLPAMQELAAGIEASEKEAVQRFRRVHVAALLMNFTQLVVLVWGTLQLSRAL